MVRFWHRHWLGASTTVIKINGFEEGDHILCRYYITYYNYCVLQIIYSSRYYLYIIGINGKIINDNVSNYSSSKINLFRNI